MYPDQVVHPGNFLQRENHGQFSPDRAGVGVSQSGARRSSRRTAGELKIGARACQFRWPVTKGDRDQRGRSGGRSDCGLRLKV